MNLEEFVKRFDKEWDKTGLEKPTLEEYAMLFVAGVVVVEQQVEDIERMERDIWRD